MYGIYLAACKAQHINYQMDYNDIVKSSKHINIIGDMLQVDLTKYDYIIATPPCNWWTKANPYYKTSEYALSTKHLLPDIIIKLGNQQKPFIIENVINKKRYTENGIYELISKYNLYYQYVGRHMYITNINIDLQCEQHQDFKYGGVRINKDGYNQGGSNVHVVIEKWLDYITK